MPFDALKDLVPVAAIGDAPQMIALSTEVPAKTFKEFQALAKAKPGTFSYGSAGPGSLPHLSMAEFAHMAGIELVHVPYRGNAPAMTDLIARAHPAGVELDRPVPPGDGGGKNPAVAHRDEKPAAVSAGCADLRRGGAAGLHHERVDRRRRAGRHARAGARPHPRDGAGHAEGRGGAKKAMAGAGLDVMAMSRPEFASFVKAEYARWEKIVKDAGVEKQ